MALLDEQLVNGFALGGLAAGGARVAAHAASVIPAHPLALDADRKLDVRRQRALTRYYLDAGAGGLAVGVHTTQFAIREAGLYRPVLELAMRTAAEWTRRPVVMIAGARRPHRAGRRARRRSRAISAITPAFFRSPP